MMAVAPVVKKAILAIAVWLVCTGSRAGDLVIAMPDWSSGQATANILKVSLKQEFGLDADAVEMGTLIAFAALDSGTVDIHPEVWLPNLDNLVRKYVTDAGTVVLSPVGVDAWQGMCATRAAADAGINDIADLNDPRKTAVLDTDGDGRGEIWIGAPAWSSTAIERIRASSYGYGKTVTLLVMPEDVGMAAVDAAAATEKPLVFACYAPHAVFKLHDIVRLSEPPYDPAKWNILLPSEDPLWEQKSTAASAWNTARYHIAYAASLRQKHPDVAAFLDRVAFTPEEATEMSYALQVERQDPYEFAKRWVAQHEARVKEWTRP